MCMLMNVIDKAYIVHETGVTGVATMQIKIAFYLQYPMQSMHVLTSDVASLLS